MIGLLSQVMGQALVGVCFASASLALSAIALSLRMLPRIVPPLGRALRGLLSLSVQGYRAMLAWAAPSILRASGVDVKSGAPRAAACVLLSVMVGCPILLLTGLKSIGWVLGLCTLHGLSVALAWRELNRTDGLRLGETLQ